MPQMENIRLSRTEIESNVDVMKISKYFEEEAVKHPDYITEYVYRHNIGCYIPEGYEGWELKEYNGGVISKTPILLSSKKEIVLAPFDYVENYIQEFIDIVIENYINK